MAYAEHSYIEAMTGLLDLAGELRQRGEVDAAEELAKLHYEIGEAVRQLTGAIA